MQVSTVKNTAFASIFAIICHWSRENQITFGLKYTVKHLSNHYIVFTSLTYHDDMPLQVFKPLTRPIILMKINCNQLMQNGVSIYEQIHVVLSFSVLSPLSI